MQRTKRYIDTAEAAKLLRKELKRTFPAVKFSVRTKRYSGGSSIDVSYEDGPTAREVEAVASKYAGAGFDGSIDLRYYYDHWLYPDGTIEVAQTNGTVGSRGTVAPEYLAPARPDAELVSLGGSFVFVSRKVTDDKQARVRAAMETLQPFWDKVPEYERPHELRRVWQWIGFDPATGEPYAHIDQFKAEVPRVERVVSIMREVA